MPAKYSIECECPELVPQIRAVVEDAFKQCAEADLVEALRRDGDLAVSLAARSDGNVIGHVALSKLRSPPDAMALAPVSVASEFQRQGVGSALISAAIEQVGAHGAALIFVLGDPGYYTRLGFSTGAAMAYPSQYAGLHFMAMALSHPLPAPAPVIYASAFDTLD